MNVYELSINETNINAVKSDILNVSLNELTYFIEQVDQHYNAIDRDEQLNELNRAKRTKLAAANYEKEREKYFSES